MTSEADERLSRLAKTITQPAVEVGHAMDNEPQKCRDCKHSQRYPRNEYALGCVHENVVQIGQSGNKVALLASVCLKDKCKGDWYEPAPAE